MGRLNVTQLCQCTAPGLRVSACRRLTTVATRQDAGVLYNFGYSVLLPVGHNVTTAYAFDFAGLLNHIYAQFYTFSTSSGMCTPGTLLRIHSAVLADAKGPTPTRINTFVSKPRSRTCCMYFLSMSMS